MLGLILTSVNFPFLRHHVAVAAIKQQTCLGVYGAFKSSSRLMMFTPDVYSDNPQ